MSGFSDVPEAPPPPFLFPGEKLRQELDSQQVIIQLALFGTFLIFTTILILGFLRSRGNSYMKLFSTYFFIGTAYLISFIPGLMSRPGQQSNDLYVFWVAFMAYLSAAANQTSCYTLGDNEDRKKRLLIDYLVAWPLIIGLLYDSLPNPEVIVPIVIVFMIVFLKLRERSYALSYATNSSKGLSRASKIVSDFAMSQKQAGDESRNNSYNIFLVGIREAQRMVAKQSDRGLRSVEFDMSKLVTLDMILDPNNKYLKENEGKELKTTCISFAMFWVLLAKMVGHDNVDTKIFKGDDKIDQDPFELVEKELSFLYEYLFTNYYAIYDRGLGKKVRDISVIFLFILLTLPLLIEYRSDEQNIVYFLLRGHVLDTGFTRFVILAIIGIELTQIAIFMTSKWAKVMYTCMYLGNSSKSSTPSTPIKWMLKIVCSVRRPRLSIFCFSTLTKRKIAQYSISKCYYSIPLLRWVDCCVGSFIDLAKIGHSGSWDEVVTIQLQQTILEAIRYYQGEHEGKFTNGVSSLKKNGVDKEDICTFVENVSGQARIILIWHVATSLFEDDDTIEISASAEEDDDTIEISASAEENNHLQTATIISNYCAYLVAFLPQILPDNVYKTQCEFDGLVQEFDMKITEEDLDNDDPKRGINGQFIQREARKLKAKLQQQSNWSTTLAEFWTEMLMFLALSDHSEAIGAHADSLCVGGEFITHLWALGTHAGCSKAPIKSADYISDLL